MDVGGYTVGYSCVSLLFSTVLEREFILICD